MYIFVKSCENAKSSKDINSILSFNWLSILPAVELKSFDKFVNTYYKKLYYYWFYDKFKIIKFIFLKKKIYKRIVGVLKKINKF